MTVGFVGLGTMGGPMAGHLAKAGHDTVVWNRTPGKADAAIALGARRAETMADLASHCEIVFLCVTTSEDVSLCMQAMLPSAKPGTIFVDHSTISPVASEAMHRRAIDAGCKFIDAPITGGSAGAINGALTIFCGGDQADYDKVKPVMDAYTKRSELVGGPGRGQMMKMANQIAVGGALLGLCESLSFAQKAGLDVALTRELLSGGAAGSWAMDHYGQKIIDSDWSLGFSVSNQRKDFGYCREAAGEIDAVIPMSDLADELLKQMDDKGQGGLTTAALYSEYLEMGRNEE